MCHRRRLIAAVAPRRLPGRFAQGCNSMDRIGGGGRPAVRVAMTQQAGGPGPRARPGQGRGPRRRTHRRSGGIGRPPWNRPKRRRTPRARRILSR